MFLDISSQALPVRCSTTKRGEVMKLLVFACELQKLLVIVDVFFAAVSEHQPQFFALVSGGISQHPMQHRTERGDTRASGNENRVAHGRAQNEIAERSLAGNLPSFFHVAEKI